MLGDLDHMNVPSRKKVSDETKPRIVLFGASVGGQRVLEYIQSKFEVVAFSDNNDDLHGTEIKGIPVIAPQRLTDIEYDFVVITSQWFKPIRSQLTEIGIPSWRVTTLAPPLLVGESPIFRVQTGKNKNIIEEDEDQKFLEIWDKCKPFTMTSFERGLALFRAVRYIVSNNIKGAFVECGVWRGGSAMIAMLTLVDLGVSDREFYLFDTYAGMTQPDQVDIDLHGRSADALLNEQLPEKESSLIWAYAPLDEVQKNVALTGYDTSLVNFIEGDVSETLSQSETGSIALLRLDTDFYKSTYDELKNLYPRLIRHGILIIDDYGHWGGAQRAVDDYFSNNAKTIVRPFFHRIDYTGRMSTRTDATVSTGSNIRYDYRPPGLKDPNLIQFFPSLVSSNTKLTKWPYLRHSAPHTWRIDTRNTHDPVTGVLSVEEALLLHNNAAQFKGKAGLEIGCHFGWSTAHLVSTGLRLDVVDPGLAREEQLNAIRSVLDKIYTQEYKTWAGYSPSIIDAIAAARGESWSFAFIDGNHEGDHPRMDAMAVAALCAPDALVMFHDMTSPWVANGLKAMRDMGWNVGVYNTMQMMGVAWRGDVKPVQHVMDRAMPDPGMELLNEFPLLSVREGH